jgi:hypothetical protein
MGWDSETAIPTDGRLAYLRLEWLIAPPLKKNGRFFVDLKDQKRKDSTRAFYESFV